MIFPSLKQQSTYSILEAIGYPKDIVKANKESAFCSITEKNNMFSSVKLASACKKSGQKPIFGSIITFVNGNNKYDLLCHAKNYKGFQSLLKIATIKSKDEISLEQIAEISDKNLLVCLGSIDSEFKKLFNSVPNIYIERDYEEIKKLVDPDWKNISKNLFDKYDSLFGRENVYAEIDLSCESIMPASLILARIIRNIEKDRVLPTYQCNYQNEEDSEIHRILISSSLKSTLLNITKTISDTGKFDLMKFFRTSKLYPVLLEEALKLYNQEEIDRINDYASKIESINLLKNPEIPDFPCPNNMKSSEYLRQLCLDGWNKKIVGKVDKSKHSEYGDRVKYELSVINNAHLADYFLIVQDITKWARHRFMVGPGRGSAAGSLVAYLTDITRVDPIEHGLIFERFYNEGRNSPGKISLPDIDSDFPIERREEVVSYIIEKWGEDRVGQICTFSCLKGKNTLKEVLRIKNRCSFNEQNKITSFIPDESKISDKLNEIEQQTGEEASIIEWAIDNVSELNEWCRKTENGLEGPFAKDFEQAIKLEGCIKSHGKHAAGLIISKHPLAESCPLVFDKSTQRYKIGYDMKDVESIGHVKMDILGVKAFDDLMTTEKSINEYPRFAEKLS